MMGVEGRSDWESFRSFVRVDSSFRFGFVVAPVRRKQNEGRGREGERLGRVREKEKGMMGGGE